MGAISVELRSTNHRYLEIDQRLPNGFGALQERMAGVIRAQIQRGRVEASISVQTDQQDRRRVVFDERLLTRYHEALLTLKHRFALKGPLTLEHLLALPHALSVLEERVSADQIWEPLSAAVASATHELVRTRRREGAKLVADLRRQLQAMERHLAAVKRRLPKALESHRRHLKQQLHGLLGSRASGAAAQLKQAVALVEGVEIHEEIVRLESHIAFVRTTLTAGGLLGKRLDFIAQELMREANTMGAKVNDAEAAQHVVALKGCIEKIREQVQNLE